MIPIIKNLPSQFLTFSCITGQYYLVSTKEGGVSVQAVPPDYAIHNGQLKVTGRIIKNDN